MNKHSISSLSCMLHGWKLGIASLYLLLGSLGILISDQVAAKAASHEEMPVLISLFKGLGYVFVTSILLYGLIQRCVAASRTRKLQSQRVIDPIPACILSVGADPLPAADKEREAFSDSVFPDLRAFLRISDGYTCILVDNEWKRVCSVIRHNAQCIGQLIDDLPAFFSPRTQGNVPG